MCLWFLALKARKAGNRPRTFYTGVTVVCWCTIVIAKLSALDLVLNASQTYLRTMV